jgi:glycerol-3-phosphate acyltransferase PlsY
LQDLAGPALLTLGLVAIGGYLLGSIPFGVVLTRAAGAGDVRNIGSGNIGATNVLRTGRKDLAIATLILDAGKGAVALLIARHLLGTDVAGAIAGGAAFLGHLFPVWLGFKGGKGVATALGVLIGISGWLGLICAGTWLLTALVTRYSSLAALVAAAIAPLAAWALGQPMLVVGVVAILAALLILRHRENIQRLLKGQEGRIGAKKKTEQAAAAAE